MLASLIGGKRSTALNRVRIHQPATLPSCKMGLSPLWLPPCPRGPHLVIDLWDWGSWRIHKGQYCILYCNRNSTSYWFPYYCMISDFNCRYIEGELCNLFPFYLKPQTPGQIYHSLYIYHFKLSTVVFCCASNHFTSHGSSVDLCEATKTNMKVTQNVVIVTDFSVLESNNIMLSVGIIGGNISIWIEN